MCFPQEWEDRDDDDIIVIERILLLIRNILHINPEVQEEKVHTGGDRHSLNHSVISLASCRSI